MMLEVRAAVMQAIREFFVETNCLEVTTPTLIAYPGQEPNLEPMQVEIFNEKKQTFTGYLHTSPEYTLKKCLAAGLGDVYSMGPAYRNQESFGGNHNPEFTMLEWYRVDVDMHVIMDDLDRLFAAVSNAVSNTFFAQSCERLHMRDVWQQYVGVNLDDYLTNEAMYDLVVEKGFSASKEDSYEVLFYILFLNFIEPHLGIDRPVIIHHYPAQMAALAKINVTDTRYAERFEVYVQGVELANAFSELTEAAEQRTRLEGEQQERTSRGMSTFALDEDFLEAVALLPKCAGIAFGIDRFVQLLLGCKDIDDVLVLPCSKIFK